MCVCVQFVSYQAMDPEDYRGLAHDGPIDCTAIKISLCRANILHVLAHFSAGLYVYIVYNCMLICIVFYLWLLLRMF